MEAAAGDGPDIEGEAPASPRGVPGPSRVGDGDVPAEPGGMPGAPKGRLGHEPEAGGAPATGADATAAPGAAGGPARDQAAEGPRAAHAAPAPTKGTWRRLAEAAVAVAVLVTGFRALWLARHEPSILSIGALALWAVLSYGFLVLTAQGKGR